MDSTRFYADMPTQTDGPSALLADPARFSPVPADWEVLLTDVRGSTQAVGEGRLNTINLVASGCIIAALNLAHREGNELPFFFGGDGATLMVPPALADRVASALALHRDNTSVQLGLDLRVGRVTVAEIHRAGARLDVARVDVNGAGLVLPVVLGEGLQYAEHVLKGDDISTIAASQSAELDLSGMECRWSNILPPQRRQEIVCLIVVARDVTRQGEILAQVLSDIDAVYGPLATRCPISRPRLRLHPRLDRIASELRLKLGHLAPTRLLSTWLVTMLSKPWLSLSQGGRHYLDRLVQLSNTLTLDGRISTVVAGTAQQRVEIARVLRAHEERGVLVYGLEVCSASLMSCYVRDRRDQHIHFVDGQGGGYTRAAIQLKRKLAGLV